MTQIQRCNDDIIFVYFEMFTCFDVVLYSIVWEYVLTCMHLSADIMIIFICTFWNIHIFRCGSLLSNAYGVALVSSIDKMIGLFCKRALWKRQYSAKETYNLIDPTDCSHPIWVCCYMYAFERACKDDIIFAYFETFAYFDMVHYSNVCEYAVICIHLNIFFGEIQEFFVCVEIS